ncbi:MAG: neutral/alkaline non-lysosomal ceramidase N-terminal domain-containing protein [Bradymonadaceae bacterium]
MRRLLLLITLVVPALGCQPGGGPTPDASSGETGVDAASDAGGGCELQAHCPEGTYCHDGECRDAPSCGTIDDWDECVSTIGAVDRELGRRAVCRDGTCQVACVLDRHCPEEQVCTDYGQCRSFDGHPVRFERDPFEDSRSNLRAGVGEQLLRFPIGMPLGGYGSRMATDDGRYAESLEASHGQMHGLEARAIALENELDRVLMIRLPIIFSSMALHEAIARRLHESTGRKWRDELIVAATHTHSGPARFYRIPDESLLPLGRFGIGKYSHRAFQWLVRSATEAARRALDDLQPAKLGVETIESFDTDNAIASDRRSENPPFDDNRLLLVRIDDTDGKPIAAAISMGVHGTIHSGPYANGDAPMALERGLARALAQRYDRSVPVLFFNQNGGTMSPRGGQLGHEGPRRFEKLGADFAARAIDDFVKLETDRAIRLDSTTYRFPITYDLLGYQKGEFGSSGLSTLDDQYQYGAMRCHGDPSDTDPSTHIAEDDLSCFGIHRILYNRPPTIFVRSQMSFLQLADTRMVTLPGEPSMSLGWQVQRAIRDRLGLAPATTWTLGYAQDHLFYLLATNLRGEQPPFPGLRRKKAPKSYPNYAFSFLQGGYETTMSFWGWRLGDFLVERAATVSTIALDRDSYSRQLPRVKPHVFNAGPAESFPLEPTPADRIGTVVESTPDSIERFETLTFGWVGGDPGAEMPQAPRVVLERRSEGDFQPVRTDAHRPYDNRSPVMLTWRRRTNGEWRWFVYWEELRDFPAGTYRFRVEGHQGENREAYELTSSPFELSPSDDLQLSASRDGDKLVGTLGYPAGESLDIGNDSHPAVPTGHFRLRDRHVPPDVIAPPVIGTDVDTESIEAKIRRSGTVVRTIAGDAVSLTRETATVGGQKGVPRTRYAVELPDDLSAGSYTVRLTVEDTHGNRGQTTVSLDIQ